MLSLYWNTGGPFSHLFKQFYKGGSSWADCLWDGSLLFALLRIFAFLVSSNFFVSMRAKRQALLQLVHCLFPKAAHLWQLLCLFSSLLLMQSISIQLAGLVNPFRIGKTENLSNNLKCWMLEHLEAGTVNTDSKECCQIEHPAWNKEYMQKLWLTWCRNLH